VWEAGKRYPVWMSHGDAVTVLPPGFTVIAKTTSAPVCRDCRRENAILPACSFTPKSPTSPEGDKLLSDTSPTALPDAKMTGA